MTLANAAFIVVNAMSVGHFRVQLGWVFDEVKNAFDMTVTSSRPVHDLRGRSHINCFVQFFVRVVASHERVFKRNALLFCGFGDVLHRLVENSLRLAVAVVFGEDMRSDFMTFDMFGEEVIQFTEPVTLTVIFAFDSHVSKVV